MIGKKKEENGVIKAYKDDNSKKVWFSVEWAMFGKKAINSDEMLKNVAKRRKKGKATIAAEWDVLYAKYTRHRRRFGEAYYTYVLCPKPEANIIFAFPKKWRKPVKSLISTIELPE